MSTLRKKKTFNKDTLAGSVTQLFKLVNVKISHINETTIRTSI